MYTNFMNSPWNKSVEALLQDDAKLERLYPPIYYKVYPEVVKQCNEMQSYKGEMYVPTKEEYDNMVNTVREKVQNKMDRSVHEVQYGGLFTDLVGIILLGELIGRRRRRPYRYRRPYGRY